MGYVRNLVVSFDQLLNTICGGDPDNTISARVGYFANIRWKGKKSFYKPYWKLTEKTINWTYTPAGEPQHCWEAFEADPIEEFYKENNNWTMLIIMSLIIIPICISVGVFLHLLNDLGIIKSITAKTLPKIRSKKWITMIFLSIISIIMLPACFGILLLIIIPIVVPTLVWVIVLILLAILLMPISGIVLGIRIILKKIGAFKNRRDGASQNKNEISSKVRTRIIKGARKFICVFKNNNITSTNTILILDMFQEIFGYYKYSGITLEYTCENNFYILTIEREPKFLILVYPKGFNLNQVSSQSLVSYNLIPDVSTVILTNGISWAVFKTNMNQPPAEITRFNFLKLVPEKHEDMKLLYSLCKEYPE